MLLSLSASAAPADDARSWLAEREPDAAALVADRVVPWAGGDRVRLAYAVGGVPVEGWDRVVVLDAGGQPRRAAGSPLRIDRVIGDRRLTAAAAADVAQRTVSLLGDGRLWPARAEPVLFVRDGVARHAFGVDASIARPPATFRLVVDAADGRVLHTAPTSFSADGNVFPLNPENSDVARVALPGVEGDALSGPLADVFSCDDWVIDENLFGTSACHALSRHAQPDGDGHFLFDPDPGSLEDPFAEVQLYYHLDLVAQWFDDTYGFAHDTPMRGITNFPMTNAFFGDFDGDGDGDVSFGSSDDGVDFGYDADVIYHEYGHSVVSAVSGLGFLAADDLGMDWSAGGLNEGTADAFALLITGDPLLGEYAGTSNGRTEPIRDLTAPRVCPDALAGESHYDGELWGALVWGLMQDPRVGPGATAELVYGALATWTSATGFSEAGESLLLAAGDLADVGLLDAQGQAAVVDAVDASGLVGCERILPLDDGRGHATLLLNLGLGGDFEEVPGEVQYRLDVPADAYGLRFEVTDFRTSSDELGWNVYVRRDEPVGHEVVELALFGVALARPTTFDHHLQGAGPGAFELTLDSDPPLRPGATYYFSLSSDNLGGLDLLDAVWGWAEVDAALVEPESKGSCACHGGPAAAWWLWLVVLPVLRRSGAANRRSVC